MLAVPEGVSIFRKRSQGDHGYWSVCVSSPGARSVGLMQLADAVREISSTLPSEARNVFLKTPEGLETPSFRLLADTADVGPFDHAAAGLSSTVGLCYVLGPQLLC